MKSKTPRNTTRSRNVKKTKRRSRNRRRRQRTKRGGMLRAVSALRSTYYHDFIPLITQYRNYLLTQKTPLPSDGVMVNHGEKYRTLLEGVEIDNGVKESIRNFKKELEDPVKGVDKFKALAEMYNKLISKLEEEERKRKIESAHQQALARGNTSSFTRQRLASSLPSSSQRTPSSSSSSASPSSSRFANTPSGLRVPLTTIESPSSVNSLTSPQKPRTKSELSRYIVDGDGDGDDDGGNSQVKQQLFPPDEISTPTSSPTRSPNGVAPKSKNNKNPTKLSPMRRLPPY
jgi:hypothetical protein